MRSESTFIELARRSQIIEAAIEQLAEYGYARTTLSAIAGRIGVSKASLLYHFAGKDELLRAVVDAVVADATEEMTRGLQAETSSRGRLRAYIEANLAYIAEHRQRILALAALVTGTPPSADGATVYEPLGEQAVQELSAGLEAGQRAGELGTFSAAVVARAVRGAIDALTPVVRADPTVDLTTYADELSAIFDKVVAP